jgi:hypothetical protein
VSLYLISPWITHHETVLMPRTVRNGSVDNPPRGAVIVGAPPRGAVIVGAPPRGAVIVGAVVRSERGD